ncbi:MAG TPA: hypothetical protein GXZ89_01210 [Fastidiosipila sp.]|jgi:division/cell wall cluster transcriptional repressor MraZ|nr:hypothetical protein [Fastidiosipila sp.]
MARLRSTVDAKGRFVIPAKLRQRYDGPLWITVSLEDGYLSCYEEDHFNNVRDDLFAHSGTDTDLRRFRYRFVGEAIEVTPDGQGRVSISNELWSLIGVTPGDEIYVTDMYRTLEICQAKRFDEELSETMRVSNLDISKYDIDL